MSNDHRSNASSARNWAQALSAIPDELPPAGGWSRLVQVLDAEATGSPAAPQPRRRWRPWLALAATIAALALLPALFLRTADEAPPAPVAVDARAVAANDAQRGPARLDPSDAAPPEQAFDRGRPVAAAPARAAADVSMRRLAPAGAEAEAERRPTPARETASVHAAVHAAPAPAVQPDPPASSDPLQPLYAESAQLEALVALAGDDRMASASGAALTGELGAGIAGIDARLAQPGLAASQRAALWRQRVALLRQLAGIESTERWLAMHGETFGDALVRVD